jgi:hypothetical protein
MQIFCFILFVYKSLASINRPVVGILTLQYDPKIYDNKDMHYIPTSYS